MVAQRQSLQRQGVPIKGELEGPRVVRQRATYTSTTEAPRTPRSTNRVGRNRRSSIRQAQGYGPTRIAEKGSSGVGLLEAEFFGILFLLIVQLLVGQSTYGDKMMSFMKRGTLTAILFFFLALIAGIGPNAAKVSKGIGALVFVGILVSTPGQDVINGLDNFFKANWTGSNESAHDATTSSDTGTHATSSGNIDKATSAASNAANTITNINIPGIGPIFAAKDVITAIKNLFHL